MVFAAEVSAVAGAVAGMAAAGGMALGTGMLVMVAAARRHRAGEVGESARARLGLACTLWGAGQVLLAIESAPTGTRSFGAGDVVSIMAAPGVALALLRMPRRSRASRPGLRLSLDAVLLASACTLAVWWFLLEPALLTEQPSPTVYSGALTGFVDVLMASLVLLVWSRDQRRGALALFVGAALQALADILTLVAVLGDRVLPWQAGVVWCFAWPVIGLGVLGIALHGLDRDPEDVLEDLGESRSTTLASMAAIVVVAVVPVAVDVDPWSGVPAVLIGVITLLALARELLSSSLRRRLVTQLGTEALRDALTGLPDRRALTIRVRTLDLTRPWVLLTVDLDGFKEINDLLGPQAGDELIAAVGGALARNCPPGGMVARIGGDEFGVLVHGDVQDGGHLAKVLARAVRTVPTTRTAGVPLSACIGVGRVLADSPGANVTPDGAGAGPLPALLDPRHDRLVAFMEAATALSAAKAEGRDHVAVYPGAVEEARERRLVLEWRLRQALAEERLQMYAQPLVDLRSGEVRGFESLARWTDELLGPVSPAEFVPLAEQTGLITMLGDFALRSTLVEAATADLIGREVEIGVNVSPIQLRLPRFASRVVDLVAEFGLPPRRLLLEVTEATLVDEDDPAAGALAELAAAGVRLAIDDFGTGYSALGYLRRLPLDVLKIDRSWVTAALTDERTRHIVSGVVGLAHQLGATVVMEGVEDAAVAAMCLELGADVGQGWHFGRPMPWAEAPHRLHPVRERG